MTVFKSQKIIVLKPVGFIVINGNLCKVMKRSPIIIYKDIPVIDITHLPPLQSINKKEQDKVQQHHPIEGEPTLLIR